MGDVMIRAACNVFDRQVVQRGDTLVIPLVLAPFNGRNLFPLIACEHHSLKVLVKGTPALWDSKEEEDS
jgi:hypothetical protein